MSSLSFKNRASNYLRNMQIKAKQKFQQTLAHTMGVRTNNEIRANDQIRNQKIRNDSKEDARVGYNHKINMGFDRPTNVWEKAKQRGKVSAFRAAERDKREAAMRAQAGFFGPKPRDSYKRENYTMNKHNTTTRNNFNAKALAQKKAPGGMAVYGGRKGNTRRNRKNRRGTRKN